MATSARTGNEAKSKSNGTDTPSIEDVNDQMHQLRDDLASLTDTVTRLGTGKVDEVRQKVADVPGDMIETYENLLDSMRGELDALERNVSRKVRKNPLQSIGIAAGAGFLVALLMRK